MPIRLCRSIPEFRVVITVSSTHTGIAVAINLSPVSRVLPVVAKPLPQCDTPRVLMLQFMLQRLCFAGVSPRANPDAGTTSPTEGLLTVS